MKNDMTVTLAPSATHALTQLSGLTETPPAKLLEDAVTCLMAGRGMEDFMVGIGPQSLRPARQRKDPVTWAHLEQAKRVVQEMEAKVEFAWEMLHRARVAKARYDDHPALWSRVLLGVSLTGNPVAND